MQELSNVHPFVVAGSYLDLVNYALFSFDPGDGVDQEADLEDVYDALVRDLMECTAHEIALNYSEIMQVLPYSKLSTKTMADILPPGQVEASGLLWGKLKEIQVEIPEFEVQQRWYVSVASELIFDHGLYDKGLALLDIAIHGKGLAFSKTASSLQLEQLAIKAIQLQQLPDHDFNLQVNIYVANTYDGEPHKFVEDDPHHLVAPEGKVRLVSYLPRSEGMFANKAKATLEVLELYF